MPWNFGDLLDAVAEAVRPDAPAFVHDDRRIEWKAASRRMNNLASALIARGAKPGDKLAFYLRNGIAYIEATGGSFLARLVHVNVNYRYKPDEVLYILENSDAQALIFATEFRDCVEQISRPVAEDLNLYRGHGGFRAGAVCRRLRDAGRAGRRCASRYSPLAGRHALHLHRRHNGHAQRRHVAARGFEHDLA